MASEDTPRRRIASFDPSLMNAAKRDALQKTKLDEDEDVAVAKEEARLMTSFRALPLLGTEVRNNIFASTQAFQGKQIGPVEKSVQQDHGKCEQNNDVSSSLSWTFDACDGFSTRHQGLVERIHLARPCSEMRQKESGGEYCWWGRR